jgi:hypothetical protein
MHPSFSQQQAMEEEEGERKDRYSATSRSLQGLRETAWMD